MERLNDEENKNINKINHNINRKIGYDILRILACFGVVMNHTLGIYDQWGIISDWKWIIVDFMFCLCKSAVPIFLLLKRGAAS